MRFFGIVCGLQSEADVIAKAGRDLPIQIAISGASTERAAQQAAAFATDGARGLISIGVAGGLAPTLGPGTVLAASSIMTEDGDTYRAASSLGLSEAPLLGVDRIISSVDDKAALYQQTGAAALDMESHAVAAIAARYALPLLAIRAIADPSDRVLPPLALEAVDEKGRTRLAATLFGLVQNPGALPGLMALGRDSAAAHKALAAALPNALRRAVDLF